MLEVPPGKRSRKWRGAPGRRTGSFLRGSSPAGRCRFPGREGPFPRRERPFPRRERLFLSGERLFLSGERLLPLRGKGLFPAGERVFPSGERALSPELKCPSPEEKRLRLATNAHLRRAKRLSRLDVVTFHHFRANAVNGARKLNPGSLSMTTPAACGGR